MTETARRLRRLGLPHARARAFAVVLGGLGAALAWAALGLALAPAAPGIRCGGCIGRRIALRRGRTRVRPCRGILASGARMARCARAGAAVCRSAARAPWWHRHGDDHGSRCRARDTVDPRPGRAVEGDIALARCRWTGGETRRPDRIRSLSARGERWPFESRD